MYFQDLIQTLSSYWANHGCAIQFGYDLEMGAGTFNPATFFRSLGPEPYKTAYVEPSRRPTDGRYGDNPSRLQHYFQYQVILKPAPTNIQELYLGSLKALGLDLDHHDVRFIHDDWKSPTLGAWGLGWEVQVNGMEVSQFTYFQCMGGQPLKTITGELTYGLERLAMYLQNVNSVYDLKWNENLLYGDVYHASEVQWSTYNFEEADITYWTEQFESCEAESKALSQKGLPIPAYDFVMKASHAFNLLDARGVISVTERTRYIARIRDLACLVADAYLKHREALKFPLLKNQKAHYSPITALKPVKFNSKLTKDLIFEIGVEELPHSFVPMGQKQLKELMEKLFEDKQLHYEALHTYATPNRLVCFVEKLAEGIEEKIEEKKGPSTLKAFNPDGTASKIGTGFLKSLGHEHVTLQEIEKGKVKELSLFEIKGEMYLKVHKKIPTISTFEILAASLPDVLSSFQFPQSMTWADYGIAFARPIHNLVCMLGKALIPFEFAHVQTSSSTFFRQSGAKKNLKIKDASDYFKKIKEQSIVLDPQKREASILKQLRAIENKLNLKATFVDEVLKEVVHLCEDPHLMVGDFDASFLSAPKKLIELVMVTHQRYFPLQDSKGNLAPHFVVCLNQKPNASIKKGHERALCPRLEDGVFVYDQDLNLGLNILSEKLSQMTFQKKLGTLKDKYERIEKHAFVLNKYLQTTSDSKIISNTAQYLKADLASHVVFEFPELQGVIGAHYAKKENKDSFIADAIEQHWLPRFDEDLLPNTDAGVLFALADKMDNLLSCFLTHLIPTSSSDPYALRRQTLGIIRILIEHQIHLPLDRILRSCAKHFPLLDSEQLIETLEQFIRSRMKTVFKRYHLKPDEVEAVLQSQEIDVYDLFLRAQALHSFKKDPLCAPFMEVYKRAKGQVNTRISKAVDMELFKDVSEEDLYRYLLNVKEEFLQSLEERDYALSFSLLASLKNHLQHLFDRVKILDENEQVRLNRLALLQEVNDLFKMLLDFNLVQVH